MIKIHARQPQKVSPETLARLKKIAPATLGHMITEGFMDTALRPLTGTTPIRVVGPATTVRPYSGSGHIAIDECQPGDVLVIAFDGEIQFGCWGEMTSLGAKMKGVSAVIIDGAVTDIHEIVEMGLPLYSRAITALIGVPKDKKGQDGEINGTVVCGGVTVHAGDIILGDENGIVVLPPDKVQELLEAAEPRQAKEPFTRAQLLSGKPLSELSSGARPEIVRVE
ncbi:MAG: RraA family protein [Bacillota bacterium]|jgi:regulator of RNase E activity RraA|nr:RraA family protein [Bacillota bacterium]